MISVERITPDLGAEVRGIADSGMTRDRIAALLRRELLRHHLLVVRGRELEPAGQIDFARMFGVPERWAGDGTQLFGFPAIYRISNRPGEGYQNIGRYWHADGTFLENSTAISVWHVIQHPAECGDTLFANMHLAYDTLPKDLRDRAERLEMVSFSGSVHPAVRTHPVTGRKALYTSIRSTRSFAGLGKAETDELLDRLDDHLDRPGGHYRHKWQVGDVIVGDNFSVAHKATVTDPRFPRILHRVTIRGDAAFYSGARDGIGGAGTAISGQGYG